MDLALEAQLAAAQLLGRYARAADRLDRDLVLTLFTPDAQIDMGAIFAGGPQAFADVVMGFMGSMAATRHELSTIVAVPDGADAAGYEAYVRAWHRIDTPQGTRELVVLGRYIGRLVRTAGGWRIAAHAEIIDWGEDRAVDPAWLDGNAELPKGMRGPADKSYDVLA